MVARGNSKWLIYSVFSASCVPWSYIAECSSISTQPIHIILKSSSAISLTNSLEIIFKMEINFWKFKRQEPRPVANSLLSPFNCLIISTYYSYYKWNIGLLLNAYMCVCVYNNQIAFVQFSFSFNHSRTKCIIDHDEKELAMKWYEIIAEGINGFN